MADYDAIVVGSGAGGLAAGLKIAQHGHSVMLLEAAPVLGGCLSPLQVGEYHFDVGVHYLGQLGEGGRFWNCLHELGLTERVEFVELNQDAIDRYIFPDFELRLCKGKERFREQLGELFPGERRGIEKYFEVYDRVVRANDDFMDVELRPMQLLGWMLRNPIMLRYGRVPYQVLLDAVTTDIRLQTALAASWFDYMLPPQRASITYGVGTWHHYLSGGYYPRGGSGALRDAFVKALEEQDAELRTSCRVEAIDRRGGEFVVTCAGGEQCTSKVVVSDADPTVTLGQLVNPKLAPARQLRKAAHLLPSASVFGLLVGTDLDLPSLGMTTGNLVHYGVYGVNQIFRDTMASDSPDMTRCIFVNSPSTRDRGLAPAGRHSLQILAGANYVTFERWAHLPTEKCDTDYDGFVEKLGKELISTIERYIPRLSEHLQLIEYITPLNLEKRINLVRGGIYGPELTPEQMGPKRFHDGTCDIAGLFLAGAGTIGGSVSYCVASGLKAGRKATAFLSSRVAC
jgi:phytoene dehydrogenase-like protein